MWYCLLILRTVVLTFKSMNETRACQKETIDHCFYVALFILLHKVKLTLTSVDETLLRDDRIESY